MEWWYLKIALLALVGLLNITLYYGPDNKKSKFNLVTGIGCFIVVLYKLIRMQFMT